jgi:predicted amidohydrolase
MRVAAIQMQAGLGEVDLNLERAERLAGQAAGEGAEWVILPEFFTTAMAFDERMFGTARPIDGEPAQLLARLASEHGIVVGGSFLAAHPDGQIRNTFVLAGPDGVLGSHDKDLPTMWENCWYEPGHDDGVIDSPAGPVGAAVCWELIRSQTARRLRGRVRMVVGGSCWWDVAENLPGQRLWQVVQRQNVELCRRTVPKLARLLGVPIVHANWCGEIDGRWALGTRYVSRYVQEASIVDATGRILARRGAGEGPGVITADVDLREPAPSGEIPRSFWLHRENRLPQWRLMWWFQNQHGRRYRRRTGAAKAPLQARQPAPSPNGAEPEPASTVASRESND